MTKEDAIDIIKSECYIFNPLNFDRSTMVNTALDMAVKALEQEPFKPMVEIDLYSVIKQKYIEREVLDKIRAEISKSKTEHELYIAEKDVKAKLLISDIYCDITAILDKYKTESEVN